MIIFLILLFLLPTPCFAWIQGDPLMSEAGTPVPPPACGDVNCPSGTYKFRWDGDYSGDTDQACYADCASSLDGTRSGGVAAEDIAAAYGQTGNGVMLNAGNDNIGYTVTANDLIDGDLGTIWFSVYINSISGNSIMFECYPASTDYIYIQINNGTNTVTGVRKAQSASQSVSSTDTITAQTWTRVGYSWNQGSTKHSVKICPGTGCVGTEAWLENTEAMETFNTAIADIKIGEASIGNIGGEFWIDNFFITAGYQDADPL